MRARERARRKRAKKNEREQKGSGKNHSCPEEEQIMMKGEKMAGSKSAKKRDGEKKGDILEKYNVDSEGMRLEARIIRGKDKVKRYSLKIPSFTPPTKALMDEMKREIVGEVSITTQEVLDANAVDELKEKIRKKAEALLDKHLPSVDDTTRRYITGTMVHSMLGLKDIEFLLADPDLEEVRVNSAAENVRVYHKKHGWLESNLAVPSENEIQNYADIIARRVGKQVNVLNPLLDAHLMTGDRVNVVLYPITTKGNTVTIRKFARDPWTVTDLIKNKTVSSDIMALIWLAVEYEMNVLISGGTGSGKTSFMNVCAPFIPPNHSIVSIEDTREIQLPANLYWTPMVTRMAGEEGKGEITMLDLIINSLRMRPDRIIMGEIRRQREAEVLFEAMHTGHSVYSTLHADSLAETISRLVNPPISVPENLLGAVDLCVVMFRDRKRGIRRVYQAGEFMVEGEGTSTKVRTNMLYRWKPSTDSVVPHSDSIKLFEDLSRHTGMTRKEINKELADKKMILEWMVKNDINDVSKVGCVVEKYYLDKETVLEMARKDRPFKKLLSG
ncbi:MAG: ATPase, T2SS/T4P/T4SS family [Candidatus Woesearchaeota archaeon]